MPVWPSVLENMIIAFAVNSISAFPRLCTYPARSQPLHAQSICRNQPSVPNCGSRVAIVSVSSFLPSADLNSSSRSTKAVTRAIILLPEKMYSPKTIRAQIRSLDTAFGLSLGRGICGRIKGNGFSESIALQKFRHHKHLRSRCDCETNPAYGRFETWRRKHARHRARMRPRT